MRQHGFLAEAEAHTGHPVAQRKGIDLDRTVFVDQRVSLDRKFVDLYLIRHSLTEEIQLRAQQGFQRCRRINVQRFGTSQQPESGNQTDQTETVVAVQMRNKDMVQARELQTRAAQLQLGPLAAINHKEFVAHIHHLCRGIVAHRWQCRTATQNIDFEFFHRTPIVIKKER